MCRSPWKNLQQCTTGGLIAAAQGAKPSRGHRISPGFTRKPTWLWFETINQGRFYWKPSLGLCKKLANLNLAFNRQHFPSDFGFPHKYFVGLWFVIPFFLLLAFSAVGLCVMLRPSRNFRTLSVSFQRHWKQLILMPDCAMPIPVERSYAENCPKSFQKGDCKVDDRWLWREVAM